MSYLDKPLYKLKPDEPRNYANVSNALEVTERGGVRIRHVQVNTSLFHLMRALKVPVSSQVLLYLDIEKDRAVFGMMVDDTDMYDLWSYSTKLLPPFLD
jgi:hypothetical protein